MPILRKTAPAWFLWLIMTALESHSLAPFSLAGSARLGVGLLELVSRRFRPPPSASCLTSVATAPWLVGESCRSARIVGSICLFSILAVGFFELTSRAYYVAMLWVCKRGAGVTG